VKEFFGGIFGVRNWLLKFLIISAMCGSTIKPFLGKSSIIQLSCWKYKLNLSTFGFAKIDIQ
jgi:hypothetical protein